MQKNNIIRNIAALGFLLLFILSNTPKQWLHDVFANHEDCVTTTSLESNPQFSQQGFNCDCNSLVVEAPFKPVNEIVINSSVQLIHSLFTSVADKSFPTVYYFLFQLRGPPAFA